MVNNETHAALTLLKQQLPTHGRLHTEWADKYNSIIADAQKRTGKDLSKFLLGGGDFVYVRFLVPDDEDRLVESEQETPLVEREQFVDRLDQALAYFASPDPDSGKGN